MSKVDDLMKHRVVEQGYRMTQNEVIERRAAMRKILLGTKFGNSDNKTLDNIIIVKLDNSFIVEDQAFSEFYYSNKKAIT